METSFDIIASRILDVLGEDGEPVRQAFVHIGRPSQEPTGEWALPYQIIGLGDDTVYRVLGYDAIQTLQGVHLVIGAILAATDEGERDRLRWAGKRELGFPVPSVSA